MTQEQYDRLMRCHDFIVAFKWFREACIKLTEVDIAFMEKAFDMARSQDKDWNSK